MNPKFPYEDIVNLPRPVSGKHPEPTVMERAARFAPFAAITDYEEMVLEEARSTEERITLDENALASLDKKLNVLRDFSEKMPEITVTYFKPDERKSGGAYMTLTGTVKRIDPYKKLLIFNDGQRIPLEDIFELESELFHSLGVEDDA